MVHEATSTDALQELPRAGESCRPVRRQRVVDHVRRAEQVQVADVVRTQQSVEALQRPLVLIGAHDASKRRLARVTTVGPHLWVTNLSLVRPPQLGGWIRGAHSSAGGVEVPTTSRRNARS